MGKNGGQSRFLNIVFPKALKEGFPKFPTLNSRERTKPGPTLKFKIGLIKLTPLPLVPFPVPFPKIKEGMVPNLKRTGTFLNLSFLPFGPTGFWNPQGKVSQKCHAVWKMLGKAGNPLKRVNFPG